MLIHLRFASISYINMNRALVVEDFVGLKRKICGFEIMEDDAVKKALARAQQLANRVEPPKTADICSLPTLILGEPGVSVLKQHSSLVNSSQTSNFTVDKQNLQVVKW